MIATLDLRGHKRNLIQLDAVGAAPVRIPAASARLPGVAYHDSLWIAVAAAAPIIALANQVTLTEAIPTHDFFRYAGEDTQLTNEECRRVKSGRRAVTTAYFIGYLNLLVQSIMLAAALYSLSNERDAFSPVPSAWWLEAVGLLAVGVTAIYVGMARAFRARLERVPKLARPTVIHYAVMQAPPRSERGRPNQP